MNAVKSESRMNLLGGQKNYDNILEYLISTIVVLVIVISTALSSLTSVFRLKKTNNCKFARVLGRGPKVPQVPLSSRRAGLSIDSAPDDSSNYWQ